VPLICINFFSKLDLPQQLHSSFYNYVRYILHHSTILLSEEHYIIPLITPYRPIAEQQGRRPSKRDMLEGTVMNLGESSSNNGRL
jgi:hypothetical protein